MKTFIRTAFGTMAALVAFAMIAPSTASADNYWNGYWNWYDNDYRPYYNRRHHRRNYDRDYGYRYQNNYRRYYDSPRYYRGGNWGHSMRGPHNSIDVGPLHFDWR